MPLKLIVFDMDGVLVLSKPAYIAAFKKEFAPFGIDYTEEMLDEYESNPENPNAHWAVVRHTLPEETEEKASEVSRKIEEFLSENWKEYCSSPKGTRQTIEELKKSGAHVAIATNANKAFAEKALSFYGIEGFEEFVSMENGFKDKRDAIVFLMKKFGVKPNETVYVGDVMADVKVAERAGCGFIGFVGGFNTREQLESAGATFVADKMSDLAEIALNYF